MLEKFLHAFFQHDGITTALRKSFGDRLILLQMLSALSPHL